MTYPKLMKHRTDPFSAVVVANAEQEAELPEEYQPEDEPQPARRGRPPKAAEE